MQKNSKLILGIVLAGVLSCGALAALLIDTFTTVPDFTELRSSAVYKVRLANGEKSTRKFGPKVPGWASMREISDDLLMAVIASEDSSFYSHKGVDFFELREAIKKDIQEKRWARGASTLTQQVVKNIYLGSQKTLWRKFKEILWAQQIEKVLSKSEILCLYVNMAEWGPGIYGIRQASQHYFGIPPSDLSARQSAFLAMLLPSPIRYHVYFARKHMTRWANSSVNRILNVMNSMGFIDDATFAQAKAESLWGTTEDGAVAATATAAQGEGQETPDNAPSLLPPAEGDANLPPVPEDQEPPPVAEPVDGD